MFHGGDLDSTGVDDRRMRCRAPLTRKSGGKPNCEYAARSRSLITCERSPRSTYGSGAERHLVGWSPSAVSTDGGEIFRGWSLAVSVAPTRRGREFRSGYAV